MSCCFLQHICFYYICCFFLCSFFRCKLLSLDDLWYGSQAIKIQIKKINNNNISNVHRSYAQHSTALVVLCAHWKQFKALAISALPCFVYITSSFQRSFLTRKLSNVRAVICIRATCTTVMHFSSRRKAEAERRTVKILEKQTYHLASPWIRAEKKLWLLKKDWTWTLNTPG